MTKLTENHTLKPALCLDFDGTIRESKSGETFIKGPEDIKLLEEVEEIIMSYKEKGYAILGISNQAGVAHGFKTPEDNNAEIAATIEEFKVNPFDIVMCAYGDGKGTVEPYAHRSLLRKPEIGMLALMEEKCFSAGVVIDWDNSLFVGDRPEDENCAKNAEIDFLYISAFIERGTI